MKIRDEAAAKAKADAIKAGKTPEEAETIGRIAGLEAENAYLNGEVQTGITERQTLKTALKEAEPFIAKGKAAVEGEKTAAEQLAELQGEIGKRDAALMSERRETRLRGALAKAGVRADRMDAAVRLVDTGSLTYDEKTGAFAGLDEAATGIAKSYPEFVGGAAPARSIGSELPNKGGAGALTAEEYVGDGTGKSLDAFAANQSAIKKGEKTLAVV